MSACEAEHMCACVCAEVKALSAGHDRRWRFGVVIIVVVVWRDFHVSDGGSGGGGGGFLITRKVVNERRGPRPHARKGSRTGAIFVYTPGEFICVDISIIFTTKVHQNWSDVVKSSWSILLD